MNTSKLIFFPVLLALFVFGSKCTAQPTKAQLISDLRTAYELLSKGDNMAAVVHFKGPETKSEEDLAHELNSLIANQELTMNGIEILGQLGNFGKLGDIFPERGGFWLERIGMSWRRGRRLLERQTAPTIPSRRHRETQGAEMKLAGALEGMTRIETGGCTGF